MISSRTRSPYPYSSPLSFFYDKKMLPTIVSTGKGVSTFTAIYIAACPAATPWHRPARNEARQRRCLLRVRCLVGLVLVSSQSASSWGRKSRQQLPQAVELRTRSPAKQRAPLQGKRMHVNTTAARDQHKHQRGRHTLTPLCSSRRLRLGVSDSKRVFLRRWPEVTGGVVTVRRLSRPEQPDDSGVVQSGIARATKKNLLDSLFVIRPV